LKNNLLVLTALNQTWGDENQELYFLGEWCLIFEKHYLLENRKYEINQFHWDDRVKLSKDYEYLKNLHQKLLTSLTNYLNKLHKTNHSIRYWQIILDPWLFSYLGILFDRWENIRNCFNYNRKFDVIFLSENNSFDKYMCWLEFVRMVSDDYWNQLLCQRILINEYGDNVNIKYIELPKNSNIKSISSLKLLKKLLKRAIYSSINIYNNFFQKNKFAFIESYFRLPSLFLLNFKLGQIPRIELPPLFEINKIKNQDHINYLTKIREEGLIDFNSIDRFELFIQKWIVKDLPQSIIEFYQTFNLKASQIKFNPSVIITANAHWGDISAKYWFAQNVNKGKKLLILEHGGSLPAKKELFNFEEDISDFKITWFLPYNTKHVQLPPSKLVKYKNKSPHARKKPSKGFLLIVGNEQQRYVNRVSFYPLSKQCLESFILIKKFYFNLDIFIKNKTKLKPYYNQGFNTTARYSELLGSDKIVKGKNLTKIMEYSKIIVCTYPETTFSEAMYTGVPTILLYPEHLYERNPVAYPLIQILKSVNILFIDPHEAALHINKIWENPEKWWNSGAVIEARTEFFKQALNIDSNWMNEWKNFLLKINN
jgi:putative transferase (TIGR04331 family)